MQGESEVAAADAVAGVVTYGVAEQRDSLFGAARFQTQAAKLAIRHG